MFMDRKKLKTQSKVLVTLLVVALSAGLVFSSIQWAAVPTTQVTKSKDTQATQDVQSAQDTQKYYEEEIARLEQKLKTNPKDIDALTNLATLYMFAKEFPKAQARYEQLIKLQPDNKDNRLSLAYTYFGQNKFDQAEEQVSYVLQKDPNNQLAHRLQAFIYAEGKKDYAAAVTEMNKYIATATPGTELDSAKQVVEAWKKNIKQ